MTGRVIDVREDAVDAPLQHPWRTVGALLADDLLGLRERVSRTGKRLRRSSGVPAQAVGSGAEDGDPAGDRLRGALVVGKDDGRPPAEVLARAMADPSVRQLVLLGQPGAGKTTLALLFTLAVLADGERLDPVPVLLSPAGWDPADGVEEWIAQQIVHDHPGIDHGQARRLVDERLVIPILDGLDEMPATCHAAAMADLERATAAGLRTLVTCRTEQFAEIVRARGVLPQADIVDVEPVRADDAITYLTQREPRGSTRWDAVTAALRADPQGLLAGALSTPLMISMARRVYQLPSTDPGELMQLPDVDAVRRHLLQRFLPSVYGAEEEGARAERWLAFLVNTLTVQPRDPNLLWWRLGKAVPRRVFTVVVAAAVTVLNTVLCPLLVLCVDLAYGTMRFGPRQVAVAVAAGCAWGLGLGVLLGRQTARSAHGVTRSRGPRGWLPALGTGAGDILAALAALSLAGSVTLLVLDVCAAGTATRIATVVAGMTGGLLHGDPRTIAVVASALFLGAVVVTVTGGLATRHAGVPRRCAPRLRALGPRLVTGVSVGMVIGLPWTVVGLLHRSQGLTPAVGLFRTAMVAGAIGIPLGVGSWLSRPATEDQPACSPESTLHSDRTALLASSAGIATITALFLGFFFWFPDSPILVVAIACVGIGANTFAIVFLGSGAAWTSYTIARWWLAARGRLPWRLTSFLRHAHHDGVLRQAGAAYQIRHDLLRAYLEAKWPASGGAGRSHLGTLARQVRLADAPPVRRFVFSASLLATAILLLPLTAVCVLR